MADRQVHSEDAKSTPRRLGTVCRLFLCSCCCLLFTVIVTLSYFLFWAYWICIKLPKFSNEGGGVQANNPSVGGRHIRLLSYNVFLRPFFATDESTHADDDFKDERMELILQEMSRFDVVAFQEVWTVCGAARTQRLLDQAEAIGFKYFFRSGCYPWRNSKFMTGMLLVLSRYPIEEPEELIYSNCNGEDCYASKGALAVRLRPFGDAACDFEFINTHLQAGGPLDVRLSQGLELRQLHRRRLGMNNLTVIIGGDFNAHPGTEDYDSSIADRFPDFIDVLAEDGHAELNTASYGGVVTTNPVQVARKRLDLILVRPGNGAQRVINSSTVEPFEVHGRRFTTLSDHFGVAVSLTC